MRRAPSLHVNRRKGKCMAERKKPKRADIDEQKAREEGVTPEDARESNKAQDDGGNPDWWKNEGRPPGEVH